MYTEYYSLNARPFQLTPDPHFFFEGRPHKKAMAYLTYGLSQEEGFVVITGEVGAGKTILIDHLLANIERQRYVAARVETTILDPENLLRMIAFAFGIEKNLGNKANILAALSSFLTALYQRNVRPLLIVDEVQNLSLDALEELRMLSNFQSNGKSLLQSFLIGQPQFRTSLAGRGLEQLGQRVIASHHLDALGLEETVSYIRHRLTVAGWNENPNIEADAYMAVYDVTKGIPRRVNMLMDRLLLYSFLEGLHKVDARVIRDVLRDIRQEGLPNFSDITGGAGNDMSSSFESRIGDQSGQSQALTGETGKLHPRAPFLETHFESSTSK